MHKYIIIKKGTPLRKEKQAINEPWLSGAVAVVPEILAAFIQRLK